MDDEVSDLVNIEENLKCPLWWEESEISEARKNEIVQLGRKIGIITDANTEKKYGPQLIVRKPTILWSSYHVYGWLKHPNSPRANRPNAIRQKSTEN